jgi:hypothetical protein
MGGRFGHDFSRVRVHTDEGAAASARALGARAYTVGPDIVFGAGEYRPGTREGRWLLAHELAHVAQGGGRVATRPATVGAADTPAEREATTVAASVAGDRGTPPVTQRVPTTVVQRQPDDAAPEPVPAQAPVPVEAPVPAQAPVAPWSPTRPGTFGIMVESAKATPAEAFGVANSGLTTVPLSAAGQIEHFCATPASYPIRIRFYTDAQNLPRPQPFTGPQVSVALDFVPDGQAAPTFSWTVKDTAPRYTGPGAWLVPSFGTDFAIEAAGSGYLTTRLELVDAAHSARVAYVDRIRCYLAPCA